MAGGGVPLATVSSLPRAAVQGVVHVIGYTWRGGVPALRIWAEDTLETPETLPLAGELCLTPLHERRCVGRIDFAAHTRLPCPDRATLSSGTQCGRCLDQEGYHPCMRCDGVRCPILSPEIERYCRQTHHLYLADFGAGSGPVKVGTAADGRRRDRVIEQGPVAAAYVAAAGGPAIKRLEKIASSLGLTERVTRRRKGTTAFAPADEVASRQRIMEAYNLLRSHVSSEEAPPLHALEHAELPPPDPYLGGLPLHHIQIRPGATIRGPILKARGGFLLLDIMGAPGILDLGELRARLVDLTPADAAPPPPTQMSLL